MKNERIRRSTLESRLGALFQFVSIRSRRKRPSDAFMIACCGRTHVRSCDRGGAPLCARLTLSTWDAYLGSPILRGGGGRGESDEQTPRPMLTPYGGPHSTTQDMHLRSRSGPENNRIPPKIFHDFE